MEQNFKIAVPDGCAASIKQEEGFIIVSFELKKWEPKDGDIYATGHGSVAIYNANYEPPRSLVPYYCGITFKGILDINEPGKNFGFGYIDEIRPATVAEKRRLFDALAKEGKRWNAEEKRVEDLPRWRALYNENYYVIGSELEVDCQNEIGHVVDDNRYNAGNYFKTREAAERVAEQIREIFKESKAE